MTKGRPLAWNAICFLLGYHVLLLILLPFYLYTHTPSLGMWLSLGGLYILTGLSITAGYHRLYSHRSFKANPALEAVLLFFGSMTIQNSVLKWAYDHRNHHAFVDKEQDPYSIEKGFWYAHWLWIFYKDKGVEDKKMVPDLLNNRLVMFQHNYFLTWVIVSNIAVIAFFGWLFNDFLGAFTLTFLLRLFLVHHSTWFINSLAHTLGEKPFSRELSAVDNYMLAFLTFGEGYHNYHHTFANDYRNGIRWYHFDPTKWLIWTLSKMGLATHLKSSDPLAIEKRMINADKARLLEQIKCLPPSKQESVVETIHEMSDKLVATLTQFNKFKSDYLRLKKERLSVNKKELKQQLNEIKQSLHDDFNRWLALNDQIKMQLAS